MSKQIIAFAGFAQSGKDSAGKYLVENHGFTRISFADAVRDALYALNPFVATRTFGVLTISALLDRVDWETAKKEHNVRELLQRMGTEVGRQIFSENCWIDIARRKADGLQKIVFTDTRFTNEAELIKSLGGRVVRIERDGVAAINSHISDKPLPDYLIDLVIQNNGTLEDLHSEVQKLLF